MTSAVLSGKLRKESGKSAARKVRRANYLPAVLYGLKDNLQLQVNPKELSKILETNGQNVLIGLSIDGDGVPERQVILKDFQHHPLKEGWLHVDFLEVDVKEKTRVRVPVKLVGHSPGEKLGGHINLMARELEVECLPRDIPEKIEVLMAQVQLGDVVHVSDLSVSANVTILEDPSAPVVNVYLEKVKEEAPAEGEGVEEGEVPSDEAAPAEKESANKEGA
ncbi:MAG: 50S ribosomal protein L25 [Nitrospinaceae bacterium]